MKFTRTQHWTVQEGFMIGRITKCDSQKLYYWFVNRQLLDLGFGDFDHEDLVAKGKQTTLLGAKKSIMKCLKSEE